MAWRETPTRVIVEFLRSNQGASRVIRLTHDPHVVPPQLQGRIDPGLWMALMTEMMQVASAHPYSQTPNAGNMAEWTACFCLGSIIGLFCMNPDAGDYSAWEAQAHTLIARFSKPFGDAGCQLSLQRARDYYVQIDILGGAAVGVPVMAPPPGMMPYQTA